jgi:ribosomal protein S18 acetylase RimI-like enzyme
MELSITEVRSDQDLRDLRCLCEAYGRWLYTRYAQHQPLREKYFSPEAWSAVLADLPHLHAPPQGDMLIARLDRKPVGCVMVRKLDDNACEMKRLFVLAEAQGQGVGRRLCERLMTLAAERGYPMMRLDTGVLNNEAISLYPSLGFRMRGPYQEVPEDLGALLLFMEAELPTPQSVSARA